MAIYFLGEALEMTYEPAQKSEKKREEKKKNNFPFHIMVKESENNVEHLSSRGAPSGIFLGVHMSFDISRVNTVCKIQHINIYYLNYIYSPVLALGLNNQFAERSHTLNDDHQLKLSFNQEFKPHIFLLHNFKVPELGSTISTK